MLRPFWLLGGVMLLLSDRRGRLRGSGECVIEREDDNRDRRRDGKGERLGEKLGRRFDTGLGLYRRCLRTGGEMLLLRLRESSRRARDLRGGGERDRESTLSLRARRRRMGGVGLRLSRSL